MFIALSLLGGLILSWFGFDLVVAIGMKEVFDVTISNTGYYFLFGLLGAMRSIAFAFSGKSTVKFNNESENAFKKKY